VSRVSCTISEGRHRQVRYMFEEIGHPVLELERVAFGPLRLGDLASGSWRMLGSDELSALMKAAGR
ncbi:MAG: rRNA pseudouridine synthase, partial [Coriobacteriales bacterium]